MEVNGQHQALAALPPGQNTQSRCGWFYIGQNSLVCVGTRTPDLQFRNLVAIQTTVSI